MWIGPYSKVAVVGRTDKFMFVLFRLLQKFLSMTLHSVRYTMVRKTMKQRKKKSRGEFVGIRILKTKNNSLKKYLKIPSNKRV